MEIPGYENYVIFEDGDVINVNTGKIKIPTIEKYGYKIILLHNNGKVKQFKIHRLLGIAYIPNPENKKCIDHINRIRTDNRLENLRWATPLENCQNQSIYKNNTSGIKNIRFREDNNTWIFKKMINSITISKTFKKKEEAIEYKNKFYLENNIVE